MIQYAAKSMPMRKYQHSYNPHFLVMPISKLAGLYDQIMFRQVYICTVYHV